MNRHKFHDVACQGNLKFCQGIVREMSGNFVSPGVWQPWGGPSMAMGGWSGTPMWGDTSMSYNNIFCIVDGRTRYGYGGLVWYTYGGRHQYDDASERDYHAEVLCPLSTTSK